MPSNKRNKWLHSKPLIWTESTTDTLKIVLLKINDESDVLGNQKSEPVGN